MLETDVLVIGAGPVGSTAAKHAAIGGANVILIDKKSEIGSPKRCAEGVSHNGLENLGITPDPRYIRKKIDGARLVAPDGISVWLTIEEVELPEAGFILERKVFDKFMAMDAAREGTQIKIKTLAKSLKRTKDSIIVTCEHMGELFEIEAKIVIAADGAESHVARWAGLNTLTTADNMESGIQFEMCGVEFDRENVIEFYFGSCAPGGYAWIFPKGDDIANVGLAVIANKTDKTAYQHLKEFVKNCPSTQNAQAVELNVGGDPVGGIAKEIYGDNVLVCGDAAGQVNPLTGGGIISGMTGGMHAGKIAAQAIDKQDYSSNFLKKYKDTIEKEIGKDMDKYLKVKEYVTSLSDEELNSVAIAFQNMDFKSVSTTEIVKNLVKVSPKALIKLGKLI